MSCVRGGSMTATVKSRPVSRSGAAASRTPRAVSELSRTVGTPDERAKLGKSVRKTMPLADHAALETGEGRRDPVELLDEQAAERVTELVPIRYGRMMVSPFTFYRGAARVMAADLAATSNSGI